MDFTVGVELILSLLNLSWSNPVMVMCRISFQDDLKAEIKDASETDVFSRIIEVNQWIGENSKKDIEFGDIATGSSKNAIKCLHGPRSCLWPHSRDGTVYIPYTLDQSYSRSQQTVIQYAMMEFDLLTCIKFVYRRHERQYIKIFSGRGCWSNIGYNKQLQIISLQRNGCVQHGIVQHELLHSLGFNHEQSRSDRDDYVTIIYKDIIKGTEYNFMKMDTNNLGTPYDYNSVMHYGKFAFSKDGTSITIVPKPNPNIPIGQRFGMSTLDVLKINRLYNCKKCGGLFRIEPGEFTSPNFPNLYPNNAHCIWIIKTSDNQKHIFLQFTKFAVQQFINCYGDRVIIYDGDNLLAPVLDGPTCGAENPAVISSGTALLVQFFSTQTFRAFGFSANYQFVNCGHMMTRKWGAFDFRAWKSNSPKTECIWVLLVPRAFQIVLEITRLHLNKSENCATNFVAIHDAAASPPVLQGKYCEQLERPIVLTSTGRTLVLEFSHSMPSLGWGFSVEYRSIVNRNPPKVSVFKNEASYQNTVALMPCIFLILWII